MSEPGLVAQRMAGAAVAFLGTLDAEQRPVASWPFPADDERRRWFYTPTDHGGIVLGDLRPGQQRLAMQLVATGLSRPGFVTVSAIMGLENILDETYAVQRTSDGIVTTGGPRLIRGGVRLTY